MHNAPNGEDATTMLTNQQRYARGLEVVRRIGGPDYPVPAVLTRSEFFTTRHQRGLTTLAKTSRSAGSAVIASFDDLAPSIGRAIVEHAYDDVFARSEIDPRRREVAACSAFAAVGNQVMDTPLRVHVLAALTAGATHKEIIEVILNLVPHCGYPAVEEALRIAHEVFQQNA